MAEDRTDARIPALIRALSETKVSVRWNAARDLARLGPEAAPALPALEAALGSPDPTTALWARYAIAVISGNPTGHLDHFIRALTDKKVFAGMAAAAIAGLGQVASPAVPALIQSLSSEHPDNRWSAACALANIGPHARDSVSALIRALEDQDEKVRWYAAWALAEIGPDSAPAVPALIERLNDFDDDVRGYAAMALGRIGPAARAGVPALAALKNDENGAVREEAETALSLIGQ
jgi:HEAT repeat protein